MHSPENNISIIWDFDRTLTPHDSTTELLKYFVEDTRGFWKAVKQTSGVESKLPMDSISTSEAPVWMYFLSELARSVETQKSIGLSESSIKKIIHGKIKLYPNVLNFLKVIQNRSNQRLYKNNNVKIHHFIITAGLQDLVSAVFKSCDSRHLIRKIFGCRYKVINNKKGDPIKNIPIYCMDKTAKTRALFEISKGCFQENAKYAVDDLIPSGKEWCPFENMIYIGDGDTDIPAFSLVKSRRGMTIGVFNPEESNKDIESKSKNIKKGKRIDLFTPANFTLNGQLFKFIQNRCDQIAHRYEAHKIKSISALD